MSNAAPTHRPVWLSAHRLAQLAICVQFAALVRTLAEFFRLRSVPGVTFTVGSASPFIGAALLTALLTWAAVLCYFAARDRTAVGLAGLTVLALLAIKLVGMRP